VTPLGRACVFVLDGVGCGALPDAADYGDDGADTLGNLARARGGLALPHLARWGLGRVHAIPGVPALAHPEAAHGRMAERSAGKDTTTGHWEIAGLCTTVPFATFPRGFPEALVRDFERATGRGVLGNMAASGTEIVERLGAEHVATGRLIVYTSADSVFQIAAHTGVVPLGELYAACRTARALCDPYRIGRVIARPFVGEPGAFTRTYDRRDYPMPPHGPTLLDALAAARVPVVGVGKIGDIFAGRGLDRSVHTKGNADGLARTAAEFDLLDRGLLFVNLVDTDMCFGHRRDVPGFAASLAEFDAWLPRFEAALRPRDLLAVTADHGCDPTFRGTDHTREYVPLLVRGGRPADLGVRATFADLGQTLATGFGLSPLAAGTSFLDELAGPRRM
jgi:phosphopentomutase